VVWKVESIRGDGTPQPLSIYYARSEDGGYTFSHAEPVVEGPVAWREIVSDSKGNLHLLWQQDPPTTVWDQMSLDGGHTWQYPQGLPDAGSLAAVAQDPTGALHVFSVAQDSLRDWLWNGSQWKSEAPPGWSLSAQQANSVALLAAAANKQGKMMVILAETMSEGDPADRTVLYSTRALASQPKQTVAQEVVTSTPAAPTPSPSASTSTPDNFSAPTSTVQGDLTKSQSQADLNKTDTGISPYTIALFPVGLLLLAVLGVVMRQVTRAGE
jgi:hypothetical protein